MRNFQTRHPVDVIFNGLSLLTAVAVCYGGSIYKGNGFADSLLMGSMWLAIWSIVQSVIYVCAWNFSGAINFSIIVAVCFGVFGKQPVYIESPQQLAVDKQQELKHEAEQDNRDDFALNELKDQVRYFREHKDELTQKFGPLSDATHIQWNVTWEHDWDVRVAANDPSTIPFKNGNPNRNDHGEKTEVEMELSQLGFYN